MIKVTFITGNIKVSKVVDSEKKAYRFGQDMAAKYEVLFTNTPYIIGKTYLENL
jgi:hypothetical protein